MPRLTITIDDDQSELLDELTQDGGEYESKSAAVRDFIQAGEERRELQAEIEKLRDRLDSREDRIEELESQLRKRSNIEEKIEDLPDKIRGEETYTERRQRKLDEASITQRLRWKITGVPVDIDDE
jgi:Arc/MetJ-type ribon-helix-helix transcriptional regulator